jgi:hypothetical protein
MERTSLSGLERAAEHVLVAHSENAFTFARNNEEDVVTKIDLIVGRPVDEKVMPGRESRHASAPNGDDDRR